MGSSKYNVKIKQAQQVQKYMCEHLYVFALMRRQEHVYRKREKTQKQRKL